MTDDDRPVRCSRGTQRLAALGAAAMRMVLPHAPNVCKITDTDKRGTDYAAKNNDN